MHIKFCGAAQEVTGSAHLITLDSGYKILLDCGLYQGKDKGMAGFNENWYFDPKEIDCLILSHAHIDHSGRIPKLVKDGFRGTIYCTHATRSLCSIMLLDSAYIQVRDAEFFNKKQLKKKKKKNRKPLRDPLYTAEDVNNSMELFATFSYRKWFRVNEQVDALFLDAGHILGSASITLRIQENGKTTLLGFSGDVGRPDRPILRDPQPMPEVDYMLCESTYGDQEHLQAPSETGMFLDIILDTCVKRGGKLIIPAFSVGRTQEIVYILDRLSTTGKLPHIPVYVDSPLAVNATTIFGAHPECFDDQLNQYMLIDENPFGFNDLTYIRKVEASKELNETNDPCIIISASGMMNAGRVRHHLYNSIDKSRNTLLIVGYCTPETTGGQLRSGKEAVRLFGEWKMVRADVKIMDSFSAHADQSELLDFLDNQKKSIKKLFLVHGDLKRQEKFKSALKNNGFHQVVIPSLGQEYEI
ncbi:MAG: MBL fold metallo-hydrolase [Bacteroidetes bacterium]|nr:MBL fold metallo-hydrolase [Bacteroidota bacterium]